MAAILAIAPSLAAADDWREIPYRDIHDSIADSMVDGATYARSEVTIETREGGPPLDQLRVMVLADAGPIHVEIDADGGSDFPLSDALYDENPPVRTNAPRGTLGIGVRYTSEAPPQQSFSYSLLVEMADEYNALVAQRGWLARLLTTAPDGMLVKFEQGEPATAALLVDGEVVEELIADENGELLIPYNAGWRESLPRIELSRMPDRLMLVL